MRRLKLKVIVPRVLLAIFIIHVLEFAMIGEYLILVFLGLAVKRVLNAIYRRSNPALRRHIRNKGVFLSSGLSVNLFALTRL